MLSKLEDIGNKICGPRSQCLEILDNVNFDTIFSVLYDLEKVSLKVQHYLLNLLFTSFKNLRDYIISKRIVDHAKDIYITSRII